MSIFSAHKWLVLRRTAQLGFLAIFLVGPLSGFWLVKGTLASSITLDVLPLTDPFMAIQAFAAGPSAGNGRDHWGRHRIRRLCAYRRANILCLGMSG